MIGAKHKTSEVLNRTKRKAGPPLKVPTESARVRCAQFAVPFNKRMGICSVGQASASGPTGLFGTASPAVAKPSNDREDRSRRAFASELAIACAVATRASGQARPRVKQLNINTVRPLRCAASYLDPYLVSCLFYLGCPWTARLAAAQSVSRTNKVNFRIDCEVVVAVALPVPGSRSSHYLASRA